MAIGAGFAVICAESIAEKRSRDAVRETLGADREIVEISLAQMQAFAGNVLELAPARRAADRSLDHGLGESRCAQRRSLEQHGNIWRPRFPSSSISAAAACAACSPRCICRRAASGAPRAARIWCHNRSMLELVGQDAPRLSPRCAARQSRARAAARRRHPPCSAAAMPARPTRCARRESCSLCRCSLIDIGKGVLAVLYLPHASLPGVALDPEIPRDWLTLACGFAVIVGHVYPVWFGFRGGKGVATMIGVVGALDPRLLLPVLGSWFAVLVLTGYVGLASMLAGAALVVFVYFLEPGNTALLCFSRGHRALRGLHPPWQHRAYARRQRASRATTMAVSLPRRLRSAAPAARVARDGRAALGQLARASARCRGVRDRCRYRASAGARYRRGRLAAGFPAQGGQRLELLDADAIRAALRAEATRRGCTGWRCCSRSIRPIPGCSDARGRPRASPTLRSRSCRMRAGGGRGGAGYRPSAASLALSLGWTFRDAARSRIRP